MASIDLFEMEFDNEEEIEIVAPFLFQEIEQKLKEYLLEQQVEGGLTYRFLQFLDNLTNRLQEDFDEIIGEDNYKKSFMKSWTRIFALLLKTKIDTSIK